MKKIKIFISVITVSLLLFSLLLPISAKEGSLTVAEDYSYVSYCGERYVRVSRENYINISDTDPIGEVIFEGRGGDKVSSSFAGINASACCLDVYYKNGGEGYYIFIKESLLDEYKSFMITGAGRFTLELFGGELELSHDDLYGRKTELRGFELDYYMYTCEVYCEGLSGDIYAAKGYIVNDSMKKFYYVDYALTPSSSEPLTMQDSLTVWEITDPAVVSEIIALSSSDIMLDGGFNIGLDPEDGAIFGLIVLSLLLGIFPLAAGIVMFIISVKSTRQYKLLLRTASALCASAFVITMVTVVICLLSK